MRGCGCRRGLDSPAPPCRISFGKGDDFWTNVFPTKLVAEFAKDIARFGRALRTIKRLEVVFAVVPVHAMLRMFGFSREFGERMVYPLVALFFGTGNQTPYVSSTILVRVYSTPCGSGGVLMRT